MASRDVTSAPTQASGRGAGNLARRLSTETKHALKTTEFWSFVAVVLGILIAAAVIKGGDDGNGTDQFIARNAWLYVSIVTGAYLISRGLAKSGSREPYWDDNDGPGPDGQR